MFGIIISYFIITCLNYIKSNPNPNPNPNPICSTLDFEWNGKGKQIGGHAVEITGWGIENGKPYWEIENTWGPEWGINGYFKMIRGKNNCDIENNVFSIIPDFFFPYGTKLQEIPKSCISPELKQVRKIIDLNINSTGGGIDPETGYSRRVMNVFSTFDFTNKIKIYPEIFKNFKAGKINNSNITKEGNLSSINHNTNNKNMYFYIFIILFFTICSLLLFIKFYTR